MNRNTKIMSKKSCIHQVTRAGEWDFDVVSSTSGNVYNVTALKSGQYHCNCEWGKRYYRGECSHTIAVRQFVANESDRKLSVWCNPVDAKRQKRQMSANQGVYFTSRPA